MNAVKCLLLLLVIPFAAQAEYQGPSAGMRPVSVAEAKKAPDDTPVVLEGKLIRHLGGKHYEFQDRDGETIRAEISDRRLPAETFDQNTPVRLYGEVDVEWYRPREIDVKRIEIVR